LYLTEVTGTAVKKYKRDVGRYLKRRSPSDQTGDHSICAD
jgi:hypothetical protein